MNAIRLLPVILSVLLISAHFLREGQLLVVLALLLSLFLLFLKRRWVRWFFQGLLILAALEWIQTAISLIIRRQLVGEAWDRVAIIMAGVTLFSLASALVFQSAPLRQRYR